MSGAFVASSLSKSVGRSEPREAEWIGFYGAEVGGGGMVGCKDVHIKIKERAF